MLPYPRPTPRGRLLSCLIAILVACAPTTPTDPGTPPPPQSGTPSISVSRSTVAFAAGAGGTNPAAQTVTISNGGTGTLSGVTVGTLAYTGGGSGWLTASVDRDTGPVTLTLAVTLGTLGVGTYQATVPIVATGSSNSPQTVTVTLTVAAVPVIALARTTATFAAMPGGANPTDQSVAVTNGGTGTLDGLSVAAPVYTSGTAGWLTATLSGATAPASLTLRAATTALAPGSYAATVVISSSTAGIAPVTLTVQLNVTAEPRIGLSPTSLTFNAVRSSASPAPQSVAITNAGTGTLTGLTVGTVTYGAGSVGWLTVALSATSAPTTLTVTVNSSALAEGDYTATIPVQATGVVNSPQLLAVTLRVAARPSLAASPTTLAIAAVAGSPAPSARTVSITSTGGTLADLVVGAPTYTAGTPGWLEATLNTTTTPATLAVSVLSTSLAVGNYTATLPITSASAANSPATISITLSVSSAPRLALSPSTVTIPFTIGGSAPSPVNITVSNSGGGTLTGVALGAVQYQGTASGWLSANLLSSTAPTTVQLTAARGTLTPGTYSATVPVTASASNSPQQIAVSFVITGVAAIQLSADTLRYSGLRGDGQQPDQTISVTSAGGPEIAGLRVDTSGTLAPPRIFTGVLSQRRTPTTLIARATIGALPAGIRRDPLLVVSDSSPATAQLVGQVTVTGSPAFTRITTGLTQTCALTAAGAAWCWGGNGFGELGNRWINGNRFNSNAPADTAKGSGLPLIVHPPAGVTFSDLSAGNVHTCGVTSAGGVLCWGRNGLGAVGDGTFTDRWLPVSPLLPSGVSASAVSAGRDHTCALTTTAQVWCWGNDFYLQLGDGTPPPPPGMTKFTATPVQALVPSGVTPVQIAVGGEFSCIRDAAGIASCWGRIGGITYNVPTPVDQSSGVRFRYIDGGYQQACGISTANEAWCWGTGTAAELGDLRRVNSAVPVRVALPAGSSVVALGVGDRHSCALLTTRELYCWGIQGNGVFGDGITSTSFLDPIQIALPTGAVFDQISGGTFHTCALTAAGAAWCGGKNFYGLLGNGEREEFLQNRLPATRWAPVTP